MAYLPTSTLLISSFWMARIETRIASVQIIPGFPACLTILNPPGWNLPPPQSPSSTHEYPDTGEEYFEGRVHSSSDDSVSPAVGPAHALGIPVWPTRKTEAETPLVSKAGETGTLDGEPRVDMSSDRFTPPFGTSCVSGMCGVPYRN